MRKVILPAQNEPITIGGGPMNPLWYEALKSLEPLTTVQMGAASTLRGNPTGLVGPIVDVPLVYGLSFSAQALGASLTSAFAALGADVPLNNAANYFDGPSIALGAGTWFVFGTVLVIDTGVTATVHCKLWDGTTVLSSTSSRVQNTSGGVPMSVAGIITNPVGNVRISCRDVTATTGKILFNQSGNSKDSHIAAVRIA